jgi:hypothetical protein
MSYEMAYCTDCKVVQMHPEVAVNMPAPQDPPHSPAFPSYCRICQKNTLFRWVKSD